jgi:hypothetical protein
MIKGKTMKLGEMELVLAPLNLEALMELEPRFALLETIGQGMPSKPQLELVLDIAYYSAIRNHPNVTRDELKKAVDMGNLAELLACVMGNSGLEVRPPGEGVGP